MKQALIFGAGNIGRGFIGQLFSESGYAVTFVEIDRTLIDALNAQRAYTVRLVDNDLAQDVRVEPVSALHADDVDAVVEAISCAEIMATAVGVRALPLVAPTVAASVRRRLATVVEKPLNCIDCENLKGAADVLRDMVKEHLSADERAYLGAHIGFVDTVIGRMVPPLAPDLRTQDPTLIRVEPYKELPVDRSGFVGPVPGIEAMETCDNFEVYTARKLYIHNCGHAVLAYLGHLKGYTYGYEALADVEIDASLRVAWQESIAGQVAHYGVEAAWLCAHAEELHRRFANRALADTILRLGRDPVRKLGPTDRLVAPARLAEAAGVTPYALVKAIASALHFDPPEDPVAVVLQRRLSEENLETVLADVCQIQPDEPLAALIQRSFSTLHSTPVSRF
jgi:mannitol-1-phosphate 5-dehydrogenase